MEDFNQAIDWLNEGKKVRMSYWVKDYEKGRTLRDIEDKLIRDLIISASTYLTQSQLTEINATHETKVYVSDLPNV